MVYVIDLTGSDDDVPAPPPAKRPRHGANLKTEDACGTFRVPKTGPVPQGGLRLAQVVIDLCDDEPAVTTTGNSNCKVTLGWCRVTDAQRSKVMDFRRQTHAEPISVPAPPAAAALPTPVPAHAASAPRSRNTPAMSSKQLLITAFARRNVRGQAQPVGSPPPHPPATTAASRGTGPQGSPAGAAPNGRDSAAATAATAATAAAAAATAATAAAAAATAAAAAAAAADSVTETSLGGGMGRAAGSTRGARHPGKMKRPPRDSAAALGRKSSVSTPAHVGSGVSGGAAGTTDAGGVGGTGGTQTLGNGRAGGGQPPGGGAAAASRGSRAKTRHETWRRLHAQDCDLDVARGDLGALDRDSSLRFVDMVQQHNFTLEDIQDGAQAARDAVQHHKLSGIALEASSRLERMDQRTPEDLVRALRLAFPLAPGGAISDRGISWTQLNSMAARLFHPVRGPSVLLGPMDAQPKQRKAVAQRRKPEPVAAVTRPEEYEAGQGG
ncbi:hypothetical protein Vafri_4155 [Volvox africanus]|uniref:Non-structural maintenance of chromosomes element 4 n=1 Tax=Volvox africanus TaxID=51714 RepID=A0A8J4AX32_9CHLO|nr:hypothetical protein Vafri_4155 [Volvox africanus]